MIVDDEPKTRQGLATLIPWETYGFRIVHTAANGTEALEKYSGDSLDLMIVDMRMPGMSGIELIERVRKEDASIHFLILSGYADFEYAKKAITCGVEGYILKPVDEDEIISYLEDLKGKLEQELKYKKLKVKIDEENKDQMFLTVFKGEMSAETKNFFRNYLEWDKYRLLLIKLDDNLDLNNFVNIKQDLKRIFEKRNTGIVFTMKPYIGILLNGGLEFSNHQDFMYRNLQKVLSNNHIGFTAAIANTVEKIEDLSKSYDSSSILINQQFFYNEGYILSESSEPSLKIDKHSSQKQEQFQLTAVVDKLFYAAEIGDKRASERITMELGIRMFQDNHSEHLIKTNYVQLVSTLLNKLLYEYQDMQSIVTNISSKLFEIEKQPNIKQLLTYVDSLLAEIIENMDVMNTDILVKKMVDLIQRNYHKSLKIDMLAEILNYNRAYLGKLFKDYTGEYFNTYLDKVRIENGKRLLMQGLKVYQVAERIGYSNVDYFHSKFKKYEGISPSSYRKGKVIE